MRRKDREMSEDFALGIIDKSEYAILSVVDINNKPYCIPISIVREGMMIYFHSAKQGFKIDCLNHNNDVCLVCVGDTHRMPDKFTTEYESAIINGIAIEVIDDAEKIHALKILCEKHNPTNMSEFDNSIKQSLFRTSVWKITINEIKGKQNKHNSDGNELKIRRI